MLGHAYGPDMVGTLLSILMLAGALLTGAGIFAIAKNKDRRRGILMLIAGVVMSANVAIMSIPLD